MLVLNMCMNVDPMIQSTFAEIGKCLTTIVSALVPNTQPRKYNLSTFISLYSYLCPTSFSHRKPLTRKIISEATNGSAFMHACGCVSILYMCVCQAFCFACGSSNIWRLLCGCWHRLLLPFIRSKKRETLRVLNRADSSTLVQLNYISHPHFLRVYKCKFIFNRYATYLSRTIQIDNYIRNTSTQFV